MQITYEVRGFQVEWNLVDLAVGCEFWKGEIVEIFLEIT